jgi:YbbR domain-containing protein
MNNRFGLKVVSIFLGIFAWAYVNLVIPPTIRRTISSAVEYRNVPELMRITPESPRVEIEVEGSRRDFIISGTQKVLASVDLYNLRPGRAILPVKVTSASGLNVKTVNPPQIQVDAIALIRRDFPVLAKSVGRPAEGYLAEEPRINPERVTLEGPELVIKRVKGCQVDVPLELVKNSISENLTVKVIFDAGLNNDEVKIFPEKISVDVTVKQGYPRKIVALAKPVFINKPPEGKKLEDYRVEPEKLMITGPDRLIDQMTELSYRPIDLGKLTETASMPLKLEFPGEKIAVVGSTVPVIEIKLSDIRVNRIEQGLQFELKKTDTQHTSVSVSSYSLEVEGYLKDIDKIRNARLQMILDITGMAPGSYDVPLTVPSGLPANVKVVKIVPETVKIEINEMKNRAETFDVPASATPETVPASGTP